MEPRLRASAAAGESYESRKQLKSLAGAIRNFFFS
jgi:hypothetical protein